MVAAVNLDLNSHAVPEGAQIELGIVFRVQAEVVTQVESAIPDSYGDSARQLGLEADRGVFRDHPSPEMGSAVLDRYPPRTRQKSYIVGIYTAQENPFLSVQRLIQVLACIHVELLQFFLLGLESLLEMICLSLNGHRYHHRQQQRQK